MRFSALPSILLGLASGGIACGLTVVGADLPGDPAATAAQADGTTSPTRPGVDEDASAPDAAPDPIDAEVDAGPSVVDCPELDVGGVLYDGHCYFRLPFKNDWATARDECANRDAHLMTITTQGEQDLAMTIGSTVGSVWIGLTSDDPTNDPDDYEWITGEAMGPTFWQSNQPNGHSPCVVLSATFGGWNDRDCDHTCDAVCERE